MAAWLATATISEWLERVHPRRAGAFARIGNLPRAAHGMTVAHLGMAVLIAGVSASQAWKQESIQTMTAGQSVNIAGYTMTFEGVKDVQGPNYFAAEATFVASRDGETIATLQPALRMYDQPKQQITFTNVRTTFAADLIAILGEPQGDNAWVTRFYYEPMVPFIWYGVLLMAIGGFVSLSDRRHRVGAPKRATAAAAMPLPEAAAAE